MGMLRQLWSFTNARLQLLQDDTAGYLAGNLQMYSLESLEPNQPMYLSLRKVTRPQTDVDETFSVYPNPFENALNISFNQLVASEVRVAVYTAGGQRLHFESLGVLGEGRQDITLPLSLHSGVYVLKVITGEKSHQTIVVHK
jgi:hypothetical protein